ncbi:hypothetical protein Hanom_Chr16g01503081 [Helianthus anomalus]
MLDGNTRAWSDLKEVLDERNVVVKPRVLSVGDGEEEVVGATEEKVVAAAVVIIKG